MSLWMIIIACGCGGVWILSRFTPWGIRTYAWLQSVIANTVDSGSARLSDFISLTSISLAMVGILVGWFTVRLQTQKTAVEEEAKGYSEQIAASQRDLAEIKANTEELVQAAVLHLTSPVHDRSVISRNADLRWQYAGHNDRVNYLVEVMKKHSNGPPQTESVSDSCDFNKWSTCRFYATNATWERSDIPLSHDTPIEGEFFWRVAPAKLLASRTLDQSAEEVWDWSELGSFSIYPTLLRRLAATETVRVGTSYSGNPRFANVDQTGRPAGHDIDLIRMMVEGCMDVTKSGATGLQVNKPRCLAAMDEYRKTGKVGTAAGRNCNAIDGQLCIDFVAYPLIGDGLAALRTRDVDLYIGAVTKSANRESDVTRFTDGYDTVDTQLYGHVVGRNQGFAEWIHRNRRIGVVENTTNHMLARLLVEDESLHDRVSIVTFSSSAELHGALAEWNIDGVLVDSVQGPDVLRLASDVRVIEDMPSSAWKKYHKSIGASTEELAIAVAIDSEPELEMSMIDSWIQRMRDLASGRTRRRGDDLYASLQEVLRLQEMKDTLHTARKAHGIPEPSTAP